MFKGGNIMKCTKCGYFNPDGSKFCSECGNSMPLKEVKEELVGNLEDYEISEKVNNTTKEKSINDPKNGMLKSTKFRQISQKYYGIVKNICKKIKGSLESMDKEKQKIVIISIVSIIFILLTLVLYFLISSKQSATDILNRETFISVDIEYLDREYDNNAYSSKEKWIGEYVVFTGVVMNINADDIIVSDRPYSDSDARCEYYEGVAEDSDLLLKSLSKGDSVKIKGKIVQFGNFQDITVETYSISENYF